MLHHVITLCDVIIGCHSDNSGVKFEMINLNSRAIWFESEQLVELFVICVAQVTKCHTVLYWLAFRNHSNSVNKKELCAG